jgi:hypothetical protein
VLTFQAFVFHFLRNLVPRIPFIVLTAVHVIYLFLVFTTTTLFYSTLFTDYLLVIAASLVFVVGINLYAMAKRAPYSRLFFTGFLFVIAGTVNDILHYLQVINTGYYLAFLLCHMCGVHYVASVLRETGWCRTFPKSSRGLDG